MRESSLFQLLLAMGLECVNYDILNGSQFDLVDDAVWEPLLRRIDAGEYAACFACPMCATFSKLLNLPGPHPYATLRVLAGTVGRIILQSRRKKSVSITWWHYVWQQLWDRSTRKHYRGSSRLRAPPPSRYQSFTWTNTSHC